MKMKSVAYFSSFALCIYDRPSVSAGELGGSRHLSIFVLVKVPPSTWTVEAVRLCSNCWIPRLDPLEKLRPRRGGGTAKRQGSLRYGALTD